jgi:hypothetical protein
MTRAEALQLQVMEECGELAKRVSKALRFGMEEVQPGQDLTNRDRIIEEYCDLIATMELIGIISVPRDLIVAKQLKVEKYLQYSIERGMVIV